MYTAAVVAIVVYIGDETKVALNGGLQLVACCCVSNAVLCQEWMAGTANKRNASKLTTTHTSGSFMRLCAWCDTTVCCMQGGRGTAGECTSTNRSSSVRSVVWNHLAIRRLH